MSAPYGSRIHPAFMKLLALAVATAVFSGCASRQSPVPPNVSFGTAPLAKVPVATPNDAPPRILAIRFSTNDVRRRSTWTGEIVTGTNVASVEVRTSLFSIDVPRKDFGRFAFQLHVFDVPPIFIRAYQVRVIARNSSGVEAEEDFPLRIR
jgi:hypothetical protein